MLEKASWVQSTPIRGTVLLLYYDAIIAQQSLTDPREIWIQKD
jgi:hypothetical protein